MYDKIKNKRCNNRLANGAGSKRASSRPTHSCPSRQEKSDIDENLLEIKLYDPNSLNGSLDNRKNGNVASQSHREAGDSNKRGNGNRRARAKTFNFRIVANNGGGDCLFLALAEYLGDPKTGGSGSYLNVLHDQLRKTIVNYIVKPDENKNKEESYTNWNRYRQGIKISLEKHVRFFRNFNIDNTNERVEALAREEYQKYMSQVGVFGTYVELCAAMEIYSFSTTLIEEASASNQTAYFVYHLDLSEKKQKKHGKKQNQVRAHILFTGTLDQGHFELLHPIKPKKPTIIPKGVYGVQEKNDNLRYIALVQESNGGNKNEDETNCVNTKLNGDVKSFTKNNICNESVKSIRAATKSNLKRTLQCPPPSESKSILSALSPPAQKRIKIRSCEDQDNDQTSWRTESNDKISQILHQSGTVSRMNSGLLLDNELEKLAQLYTITLSELKSSFEVRISDNNMKSNNDEDEWPGVKNSRVLSFGRFQTAFMHFEPYTFTPFCPTMGEVHCIMYNGDAVLVTELDENEKEIDCNLKSGEFTLETGSLYTLENNSDYPILLRVLWID